MRRQSRASQEETNLPALWSWTSQPPELRARNVCCWNYPVYSTLLYHPRTRTVWGSGGREGVLCLNWLRLRGGSGICFKIDENHRISVFFFFGGGQAMRHVGSYFLGQGLNPHPLHWNHRVLTTGLPGKSWIIASLKGRHFGSHTIDQEPKDHKD